MAWEAQTLGNVVHDVCATDECFHLTRVVRAENAMVLGGSANFVLTVVVEGGTHTTEVTGLHALGGLVAAAGTQLAGVIVGVSERAGEAHAEIHVIRACVNGRVGSCSG